LGEGASEGAADLDGLTGALPAPYLLAYDAEDGGCRRLVDWIQRRDRSGLVVSFPFQNAELVLVAPELAGLPQAGQVHGFDTRTRRLSSGEKLLPGLFRRLPGWGWLAPLASLPWVAGLLYRYIRR
jgi:predicted DCC family thiol-disulfide oxidoreductase YuxK